jgi:mono/diheme cytochrome c family protein
MRLNALLHCWPLVLVAVLPAWAAPDTTPEKLLAEYTAKAGSPPSPERGQKLYGTNFGRDLGLSCASCHGDNPGKRGTHALTDKRIAPLAPAANAKRFTDSTVVELNFRMNCKDVIGRECTAGEKADVLSWLLTFKP